MKDEFAERHRELERKVLPLVSVLMPCYNHGDYVGNAIESILNQTYPNIELIVADNGCTDNSFEVINRYRDRIKILRLEKNDRQLCGEMLREAAAGEYIAPATADDEWMPEKIERQMEAFFSIPNLQVCFTWAVVADENMQIINQEDNIFEAKNRSRGEWLNYFYHQGNCLCFPSALFSVNANKHFCRVGRGYALLPDFYQWVSILQLGEIYIVEKPLVKFRWHINGNNVNDSAPTMENALRANLESVDIALQIMENTGDELFKEAFGKEFVNPNAGTHSELLCERFLLLKRRTENEPEFSSAMFHFYYNHYLEMERILQNQYGFSFDHYRELAAHSGIVYINLMLQRAFAMNKVQEQSLSAYRQMAMVLAEECGLVRNGKAGVLFDMLPQAEKKELRELYIVCKSALERISWYNLALETQYSEFMKLVIRVWQMMDGMREQMKLLGILQGDEEFDLFGQLVHFGEREKIDLMEAVVPYIQMVTEQLGGILIEG